MRVLVTGSRTWDRPEVIWKELDALYLSAARADDETMTVVHGDCPTGADRHAQNWCVEAIASGRKVAEEPHPANWQMWGKPAGPKRNRQMVDAGAEVCLAFIRDNSRGARHCANTAQRAGIVTFRYEYVKGDL